MADNNRIGEACWYKTFDYSTRSFSDWKGGRLRAWSTDHVDGENGFGMFPVGVVEDDATLTCVSVPVDRICFSSLPGVA